MANIFLPQKNCGIFYLTIIDHKHFGEKFNFRKNFLLSLYYTYKWNTFIIPFILVGTVFDKNEIKGT